MDSDLFKFKRVLEYFVVHQNYVQSGCSESVNGYEKYIKPHKDLGTFKSSGQGYKDDSIQKQICKWDIICSHHICINIQANFGDYTSKKSYLNWQDTGLNIFCEWKNDEVKALNIGYAYWWMKPTGYKIKVRRTIEELNLFNDNGDNVLLEEFFNNFVHEINDYDNNLGEYYLKEQEYYQQVKQREIMEKNKTYVNLLKTNYNLILTGAPGTGKTYLAQQIAKVIGCGEINMGFVQFHPSYDYTDFVEGLRPKQNENGNIGFELKDGLFKKFCEKALSSYLLEPDKGPKFIFIIDEINRGEISKIFGELFFSIDSGYRVTKGMIDDHRSGKSPLVTIRTQYSNMCKRPNAFDEALGITDANDFGHFFVPDNVYIIGTMNDIDRSVESMDFAFRRRFAFKEIKASENLGMLDDMEDKDNIIKRMENLNAAIEKVEGLSSAYHIGGSYFMKLKLYQNEDKSYDYDSLWNNHLEGLLMEYLRGMADAEKKVKELKEYYDLKQIASRDVDNE
ncbi:MAG: AAA family ATPase [Bacteroidaceae bacterium]|nr:AAA family ATPase [Bacteroidaceae bacterium]